MKANWQGGPPPISLLKEISLLSSLTDEELTQLLGYGSILKREAHSNIVIEGEFSWGVYLLLQGNVGVFRTNKLTGLSFDVGQIQAPGFFGEMSLIDEQPRSATVQALTACYLFHVHRDSFLRFVSRSPDLKLRFYQACVKTLAARVRELDDHHVVNQYQLWKMALRKDVAS